MKGTKRAIAWLLTVVLCLSAFSGCSYKEAPAAPIPSELYVGYTSVDGNYSPFFARSEADLAVVDMMQVQLLSTDRNGRVVTNGIKGETIPYNGTPYTYTGPADVVIITREDGTVDYNFTLRQDLVFSDGKPLTANDVIFTMYVLCDPTYDGPVDFASLPIVGLADYRREMVPKWQLILRDTPSTAAGGSPDEYYTAEEAMAFWAMFNRVGTAFARSIADYGMANGEGTTIQEVAAFRGYDLPDTAQAVDLFNAIVDRQGYDAKAIDAEQATSSFEEKLIDSLDDSQRAGVLVGQSAEEIVGIKKTGTYTFCVTLEKENADALSKFCFAIAPMHYFGNMAEYNEQEKKFGFPKGDLSVVREKNSTPLGAGAYRLEQQGEETVSLIANDKYYRGRPKINRIHLKKCAESNKISQFEMGELDLAVVDFGAETRKSIERINGGVVNGDTVSVRSIAKAGLGYLCISADGVMVDGDPHSAASKHLRTALMTVFSYYRQLSIIDHYGSFATVPGYPFSESTDLFTKDADGKPIPFTPDPSEDKEKLVQMAVLSHLAAAGYTVENERVVAAPVGARMSYEIAFSGSSEKKHPAYLMLLKSQKLLSKIGIHLSFRDLSNESEVNALVDEESVKIWCEERDAVEGADLYTYYFSGDGVRPSGRMWYLTEINDEKLNALLLEARAESDEKQRLTLYAECEKFLEESAVEIPLYHRNRAVVLRSGVIDVGTIAKDLTGYYSWTREIEKLCIVG